MAKSILLRNRVKIKPIWQMFRGSRYMMDPESELNYSLKDVR